MPKKYFNTLLPVPLAGLQVLGPSDTEAVKNQTDPHTQRRGEESEPAGLLRLASACELCRHRRSTDWSGIFRTHLLLK